MSTPAPRPPGTVTVLRRDGDPFEAEAMENAPAAEEPRHLAVLHKLFYDSTVDLGGLVRIDGKTYLCTRLGWRIVPPATER
jgi:hypothetical protein